MNFGCPNSSHSSTWMFTPFFYPLFCLLVYVPHQAHVFPFFKVGRFPEFDPCGKSPDIISGRPRHIIITVASQGHHCISDVQLQCRFERRNKAFFHRRSGSGTSPVKVIFRTRIRARIFNTVPSASPSSAPISNDFLSRSANWSELGCPCYIFFCRNIFLLRYNKKMLQQ